MKGLIEKRNALMDEWDNILVNCQKDTETRALTTEEESRITEIETEIRSIDRTISKIEDREKLDKMVAPTESSSNVDELRALDEKNFISFCRGEERALTVSDNGGIVPTTISSQIIEKVKELSPIYAMATKFNVGGDLIFPYYNEETSNIQATYMADMQELTEGTGKFTTVKLENFIIGTLAKISKSLMNRTDFNLVEYIVYRVAKTISEFLEKELIIGTTGKMEGVFSAPTVIESASNTTITADELIDLQMTVPEPFQPGASWIMHKNTLKVLRKLKDSTGNYLLNRDVTTSFGWSLLGKPVYITESAPEIAPDEKVIAYGDMSGLYVKFAQNIEVQILMEKYATQHAVGVVGYVECDSKIVEPQKLAVIKMAP